MQEFFEALKNFQPKIFEPKYYIVVKGEEIDCLANTAGNNHVLVTKEDYLLLLKEGHQNFYFKKEKIILKPKTTNKKLYTTLKKSKEGLIFKDSDPYWPENIKEGGYTWQIPSE